MKVLLDENLPRKLKNFLDTHEVMTVREMSWSGKTNGELLTLLEANGFEAFITADKNLQFQRHIQRYKIAVVLLVTDNNRFETLRQLVPKILRTIDFVQPGQTYEISL